MLPAMLRSVINFDADASFAFAEYDDSLQLPTIDDLFASKLPVITKFTVIERNLK